MLVTHLANAGVLIRGSSKIIIDGLCEESGIYPKTSEENRNKIISGIKPFDNIDLMMFTHEHPDHFDKDSFLEYMTQNIHTFSIVNDAVYNSIASVLNVESKDRVIVPQPDLYKNEKFELGNASIKIFSLDHDGGEVFNDVQNFAVLIEMDGKSLLHIGDSAFSDINYSALDLKNKKIDIMVAPFPNISLKSARKRVHEYIDPHHIMAVHFPLPEADKYGWTNSAKNSYLKSPELLNEVLIADDIGEEILL